MRHLLLLAAFAASPAMAGDVLLIDSTGADTTGLQAALISMGAFGAVDIWVSSSSTPTFNDLIQYEGVLLVSDAWHADGVTLGNTIADYVDAGGNFVDTTFNSYFTDQGYSLGRLPTYFAIDGSTNAYGGPSSLVWVQPGHPLAAGVNATLVPTYVDVGGAVVPGATLVANHAGGEPGVATWQPSGAGTVTSVAFFPGGSDVFGPGGIDYASTDEDVLFANALAGGSVGFYASSSGVCPGSATLSAWNGTPNGGLAVVSGSGAGAFVVPGGPCAGTVLPITGARLRLQTTLDGAGNWSITRNFNNPALCGKPVVFLDLATCDVASTNIP